MTSRETKHVTDSILCYTGVPAIVNSGNNWIIVYGIKDDIVFGYQLTGNSEHWVASVLQRDENYAPSHFEFCGDKYFVCDMRYAMIPYEDIIISLSKQYARKHLMEARHAYYGNIASVDDNIRKLLAVLSAKQICNLA